ncbi:MAG: hypothetical protein AB7V32_08625 [Candidatus Berkiella sp.]
MIGTTILFAFSSYTKGRHEVAEITHSQGNYFVQLALPLNFREKLLKKKMYFGSELWLEIDGIPGKIVEQNEGQENILITIEIASSVFESSTIKELKKYDKVSIGLQSSNVEKYLLQDHPVGKEKLLDCSLATGRTYTQELLFETTLDLIALISTSKWLGLNGSGFFIQSYSIKDDKIEFKIHVGSKTREVSIFGTPELLIGQEVNITPAFTDKIEKKVLKLH